MLLVPSLSWGEKVSLDCNCITYKVSATSKYEILDEPTESCDNNLSINIDTKKQTIYGQGSPNIFSSGSKNDYIYREENNLIITNKHNQDPDGRTEDIGLSLNRKNGNMKITIMTNSLIKDEAVDDYKLIIFHKYKFNCQISDSKNKLF